MTEGLPSFRTRIAIVGLGGTGCALLPLLLELPLAGITVMDGDTVEASNLPHQALYSRNDIGRLKVEAARERIRSLAPTLIVDIVPAFLHASNAKELIGAHELIADCTDDLHARLLIDRVCGELGVPLVSGAVHAAQVQVATLHADEKSTSLRSFFPKRGSAEQDGCDMRQVPMEALTACAQLMYEHIEALLQGDRSRAGVIEFRDTGNGRAFRIAPPRQETPRAMEQAGIPDQA